ncbi:MAG TPA: SRPBCC domain-containing protein [Acidimicrobiales bacterium]
MTTPNVPLRIELTFEVPGTPEQVWDALATAHGISAWFIPTDVEEQEGGRIVFHMGPADSEGHITDWEPPRRLVYEEPGWAGLVGEEEADTTPLATEFLVEARSGGTCAVRVVSSAFGTGADWEQEFFDAMGEGWPPYFEHLRVYLAHFAGQVATPFRAEVDTKSPADDVGAALRSALQLADGAPGDAVDLRGLPAVVEHVGPRHLVARSTGEPAGYFAFLAYEKGDGIVAASVTGYLFSDQAAAYIERERPGWQAWLEALELP